MSVLYAHAFVHVVTCVYHLYVRTTIFIYIFILFCDRANVQLSIESQFSHWGMEMVFLRVDCMKKIWYYVFDMFTSSTLHLVLVCIREIFDHCFRQIAAHGLHFERLYDPRLAKVPKNSLENYFNWIKS